MAAVITFACSIGAANAACTITGIQSITGLSTNLGSYIASAPVTNTLSLTLVLNKTGNGNCQGHLAFQGSVVPAAMSGPGAPKLTYQVMDTVGTSILYTGTVGNFVAFAGNNNNASTVTVSVSITVAAIANQTGRPSGSYSDTSVVARVFEIGTTTPVGGATPVLSVSATVSTTCTIGGFNTPSADSVTIPTTSAGGVITSPIVRSYANVVCNTASVIRATSQSGAVKNAVTAPSGFSSLINYSVTATFAGATSTLNTATIAAAAGAEAGTQGTTASSTPSGTMSVTITPQTPASPLTAGSYADTLRITVTPQ